MTSCTSRKRNKRRGIESCVRSAGGRQAKHNDHSFLKVPRVFLFSNSVIWKKKVEPYLSDNDELKCSYRSLDACPSRTT